MMGMRAGLEVIMLKAHQAMIRTLATINGRRRSTIDTLHGRFKSLKRMILHLYAVLSQYDQGFVYVLFYFIFFILV